MSPIDYGSGYRSWEYDPPAELKAQLKRLKQQRDTQRGMGRVDAAAGTSIGNPPPIESYGDLIRFVAGASYWVSGHSVSSQHIAMVGNRRWGLRYDSTPIEENDTFYVPETGPSCGDGFATRPCYNRTDHYVDAQEVYTFCVNALGMLAPEPAEQIVQKIVVEKVVEKIVEVPRGYEGTFEKREVLSFALTRELRATEQAVRQAYLDGDADESLRLSSRIAVIREVMHDLTVDEASGRPSVVVARQGGLFDAV